MFTCCGPPTIQNPHAIKQHVEQGSLVFLKHGQVKMTLACGHTKQVLYTTYRSFHIHRSVLCIPCSDADYDKHHGQNHLTSSSNTSPIISF